jgi:hypothetical protein
MKSLPVSVLQMLDALPEAQSYRITLHTDGQGQWDVEVYSRHSFDERSSLPPHLPLREKAIRQRQGGKKND